MRAAPPLLILLVSFCLLSLGPAQAEAPADAAEVEALVRGMMAEVPPLPLPLLIESMSGYAVLDWKGEARDRLEAAGSAAVSAINVEGVRSSRVNEVGNYVESFIRDALRAEGFIVDTPMAQDGRRRSTGYPDLEAKRAGVTYYIEVKTYNPKNVNTTQRSFYLSPSTNPKVTTEAYHLLIAFAMMPAEAEEGVWLCEGVKWLDLYNLRCNLKFEFNASNRDLYNKEAGLVFYEDAP